MEIKTFNISNNVWNTQPNVIFLDKLHFLTQPVWMSSLFILLWIKSYKKTGFTDLVALNDMVNEMCTIPLGSKKSQPQHIWFVKIKKTYNSKGNIQNEGFNILKTQMKGNHSYGVEENSGLNRNRTEPLLLLYISTHLISHSESKCYMIIRSKMQTTHDHLIGSIMWNSRYEA